jgi:hypothetical protein
MQRAVIEWNELTSQSKLYFNDMLTIIFWTRPMFSGAYGKTDRVLNGTDHRALKRAHGIGIAAAQDRGIVADHGRICPRFPIGFVNPHNHRSTFSDI